MSASCPNCGSHKYKDGKHCEQCGFINTPAKQLDDITLIYCSVCGCTFSNTCSKGEHKDNWQKVKL